jgi:23S rRNA (cytosine1962-C5)-methyltransferase
MTDLPVLTLKPDRSRAAERRHPWIFSRAVADQPAGLEAGDVVRVVRPDRTCVGVGHVEPMGSIRVRLLTFTDRPLDAAFWQERLATAVRLRERMGLIDGPETTACRLVHGEGDGLPGLIADWYDGHVVIEPHSTGMTRALPAVREALATVLGARLRGTHVSGTPTAESETGGCEVREFGLRFGVDWVRGQKTGFYVDQREHRRLVGSYAAGQRVLNAFSYSGGFSVHALAGGAAAVTDVDSSRQALAWANENVQRNGLDAARHRTVAADALRYLRETEETFDLVILDPPAFAKHLSARHAAIQAYRRVNAMALRHLVPGGLLFTFSCSQVVTPDLFRGAVLAAGIDEGRPVRILHQLHQPPDHPISLFHPEGEYLKGFALEVE